MSTLEKARKQREHIARLVLAITHLVSEAYLKDEHPARSADLILLAMAVKVGQSQGRPLTPTKVAAYSGMPRASAIRKLKWMEDRGLIATVEGGNGLMVPEGIMDTPDIEKSTHRIVQLIHQTSAALSKLDT